VSIGTRNAFVGRQQQRTNVLANMLANMLAQLRR
jgi:hypothetical protein